LGEGSCDSWEILAVTKTNRTLNSDSYIVKYTLPPPGLGKKSPTPIPVRNFLFNNKQDCNLNFAQSFENELKLFDGAETNYDQQISHVKMIGFLCDDNIHHYFLIEKKLNLKKQK